MDNHKTKYKKRDKKILVLDIDETLVHSSLECDPKGNDLKINVFPLYFSIFIYFLRFFIWFIFFFFFFEIMLILFNY